MGRSVRPSDGYGSSQHGDVIFSFLDGFVWASWPNTGPKLRLGRYETVKAEMRDFLSQCDLGVRLTNGTPKSTIKRP